MALQEKVDFTFINWKNKDDFKKQNMHDKHFGPS